MDQGGGPRLSAEGRQGGRIDGRTVYRGRVFDVHLDRVRFPDGSEGTLEIVRHPGAAAVLPVLRPGEWAGTGHGIVLLRQYRYAADGHVWEVPAGTLDEGESPEACARRELEEEAGLRAGDLRSLTRIYTTPGFIDERIHLFVAWDLEPAVASHERSEFIERREIAWSEALDLARTGRITDSKTLCSLLFAASFDPDLRREAGGGS